MKVSQDVVHQLFVPSYCRSGIGSASLVLSSPACRLRFDRKSKLPAADSQWGHGVLHCHDEHYEDGRLLGTVESFVVCLRRERLRCYLEHIHFKSMLACGSVLEGVGYRAVFPVAEILCRRAVARGFAKGKRSSGESDDVKDSRIQILMKVCPQKLVLKIRAV